MQHTMMTFFGRIRREATLTLAATGDLARVEAALIRNHGFSPDQAMHIALQMTGLSASETVHYVGLYLDHQRTKKKITGLFTPTQPKEKTS